MNIEPTDIEDLQIERIKAALAEDTAGGPGVPHEEVVRWIESWGTDHELLRPDLPAAFSGQVEQGQ